MSSSITATYQAGSGATPPSVLLQVAGAPAPVVPYTGAFSTGVVDGWTGSGGTTLTGVTGGWPGGRLHLTGGAGAVFSRTVTGLTIGNTYAFTLLTAAAGGTTFQMGLGVSGKTPNYASTVIARTPQTYLFTATATSHIIQVTFANTSAFDLDTIKVTRTTSWAGTRIARTDANGYRVPVRYALGGQEVTGVSGSATMTVTDYEAALTGSVEYLLQDGAGGVATSTITAAGAPGVWLSLPATADPATPTAPACVAVSLVTSWGESAPTTGSVHEVIGRADPIVNPGPLAYGAGTVEAWCPDYATAAAVRALLAGGDVALLRQPSFPALDAYLVATNVQLRPAQLQAGTQPWVATITYQRVLAP